MVIVEPRLRKGKVLTPSAIPCLQSLPTVNVTLGCAHGCGYCYIQGYANYPGDDRVVLFVNTPELIRTELARMRSKPKRVFFSPSSDPFQYQPEVRKVTLDSMRVLLEAGVEVAFLTKGFLSDEVLRLFAEHASRLYGQIGITTVDGHLSRRIEPRAAPPQMRIEAIGRLTDLGIRCTPRLDPLIPDLTDCEANLNDLFIRLRDVGVTEASASLLFLRGAVGRKVKAAYAELGAGFTSARWQAQSFSDSCGSALMLAKSDRGDRLDRAIALGSAHGIVVSVCTCKNPDIPGQGCSIAGKKREPTAPQPTLFSEDLRGGVQIPSTAQQKTPCQARG